MDQEYRMKIFKRLMHVNFFPKRQMFPLNSDTHAINTEQFGKHI